MNAAVFVDFENLYRALRHEAERGELSVREASLDILDGLLVRLRESGHSIVVGRSYAAFDSFPGVEVAHDLALLGLEPQYVLVSHTGQDSADVQLTFDVARVLFRRGDIDTIVVVSGDREFLPLARHVLEEGRELRVVSISRATSGDLRERVGESRFWDALELLEVRGQRSRRRGVARDAAEPEAGSSIDEPAMAEPDEDLVADESASGPAPFAGGSPVESAEVLDGDDGATAVVVGHIPVTWGTSATAEDHEATLVHCLELMMRSRLRHGSNEVWLSPFLKGPMSQHFAHIVHPERRALINELRAKGVIRVEERENQYAEHPYSVIVIEDDHPMAKAAWARVRNGRG